MAKKKIVASFSIDPDLLAQLDSYVEQRGDEVRSKLLCRVVEKVIKVKVDEEICVVGKPASDDVKPIMLHVPTGLSREQMIEWLNIQSQRIVNRLKPEEGE